MAASQQQQQQPLSLRLLSALIVAGVASTLLTTIFGLFHVDVFLRAYKLPLPTYSIGQFVYAIINTANDVGGAWLIDHVSSSTIMSRSDLVAASGCLFSLCFLAPFFRWKQPSSLDGVHFVLSLSLYDTMYSFTAILLGSIITDNHHMSDKMRVQFMAAGKVASLMASFLVAKIGLMIFSVDNLPGFRVFLLILASFAAVMFIFAQLMISTSTSSSTMDNNKSPENTTTMCRRWRRRLFAALQQQSPQQQESPDELTTTTTKTASLQWRKVVLDFWRHKNFRAWIGMEMLLEAQTTFVSFFLKTFVDQLLASKGVSRGTCDWLLSIIRPLTQIVSICTYIPIRQVGYPRVYKTLFAFNICLSLLLLFGADANSSSWVLVYLILYPVFTGAVQSAGFHLAQSDMVLEMKRIHAAQGRHNEPSLAGLFMGANALLCKPAESLLPIVAATVLHRHGSSDQSLFYLLIIPPLVCSALQLLSWKQFDLTPQRTAKMRDELGDIESSRHLLSSQSPDDV